MSQWKVEVLFQNYSFTAQKHIEEDGSITLSLHELDLVENAQTEEAAILALAQAILDYSENFYQEFNL